MVDLVNPHQRVLDQLAPRHRDPVHKSFGADRPIIAVVPIVHVLATSDSPQREGVRDGFRKLFVALPDAVEPDPNRVPPRSTEFIPLFRSWCAI